MSIREHLLGGYERSFVDVEHSVVDGVIKRVPHLKHDHAPRNVNQEFRGSFSLLDRVALVVTRRVGTFGFFLIILAWTLIWLGGNSLGRKARGTTRGPPSFSGFSSQT